LGMASSRWVTSCLTRATVSGSCGVSGMVPPQRAERAASAARTWS
jgi:hypothetical protein